MSAGRSEPSGILSFSAITGTGGGRNGGAAGDSRDCRGASAALQVPADYARVTASRDSGQPQTGVANSERRQPAGCVAAGVRGDHRLRSPVPSPFESCQPHGTDRDESAVDGGHHLHSIEAGVCYLAVVLDAFPRKVVGWTREHTLAAHLAIAALEQAMVQRQPPPGLVHHSNRGVQYACGDYAQVLQCHQMIPRMSHPANPYDNSSCEGFMKTLKQEEVDTRDSRDLEHLSGNVAAFIEQYYHLRRLHLTLSNRPPEEFEREPKRTVNGAGATMSFFSHEEIYPSDERNDRNGERPSSRPRVHRPDMSLAGYSSATCAPAGPASASPAGDILKEKGFA
jgi:putative transposase